MGSPLSDGSLLLQMCKCLVRLIGALLVVTGFMGGFGLLMFVMPGGAVISIRGGFEFAQSLFTFVMIVLGEGSVAQCESGQ